MRKTKEDILRFIESPDKENSYMIALALKNDGLGFNKREVKKLLKKIPVDDRIHTLQDIFYELDILEKDVIVFPESKNTFEKYINACSIIPKIVEVYNEGGILDWTNKSQYKYLPYFIYSTGSGWSFHGCYRWSDSAAGPCSHHYISQEKGIQGVNKFMYIYQDYVSFKG